MFADNYFKKSAKSEIYVHAPVNISTSLIVIIPCYREPDVLLTLQSLYSCQPPFGHVEVIILVNEPENSPAEISEYNLKTCSQINGWIEVLKPDWISFYLIGPIKLATKWAGVGMARKLAMDEALFRFSKINLRNGIIISLDADTLVEPGYFKVIEQHFKANPKQVGATVPFVHQTTGISDKQKRGIQAYEIYLRYYKDALTFAGYPNSIFTVGSAFTVTAESYMKRGGMTRRKAGEDFYFLQTLTQLGKVGEIAGTSVFPSARVSERVPFGTGPSMKKWMDSSDELFYTFNFQAFCDLKILFSVSNSFYSISEMQYSNLLQQFSEPVRLFLLHDDFFGLMVELGRNCGSEAIFNDRFFQVFNAFKILKFLNFTHEKFYRKVLVENAWDELLAVIK